ncbi:MAG TPA: TonB-dependent receptor [Vicinamibacterales bacterium]
MSGTVRDETGAVLAGVAVELTTTQGVRRAGTDRHGRYAFDGVTAGPAQLAFSLVHFATVRREIVIRPGRLQVDAVLPLALNADVTVTGKATFTNPADAVTPLDLTGVALAASQGAITARQLDARPILRTGEVLETIPGVAISQHSGEGKANQYYLRGFNLDHGTDFATVVAGVPVNMPTHGHGHGYSDLNFLVPELVSGVQFAKGPYFAEQGDFATAGSAVISYVNTLDRPIVRLTGGAHGFARAVAAASSALGGGSLLGAMEAQHNDGPWERPEAFRKVNAIVRYSRGDALNGFAVTAMGYRGRWNATDQIPARAVESGRLDRFGTLDPTDGGESFRFSGSLERQWTRGNASTRLTAYGIAYDLDLYSNFTYFLEDPDGGDQFHQADRRFVSGGSIAHRRPAVVAGRAAWNTVGLQIRHDRIDDVGLHRTRQRRHISTIRTDVVSQTSVGAFGQQEIAWAPWLRTIAGLRVDGLLFDVEADRPANSGSGSAGRISPRGGLVFGPWRGTELYINGGYGFHSNDTRGATIRIDPATGDPADPVTPLVRARGAEVGLRTVRLRGLHSTVTLWTLRLDSELVFVGDAGTTEAGRPSRRHGIEWSNYYSPTRWLTLDADISISTAAFTDDDPAGSDVPGAVGTVVSAGATVGEVRDWFGSIRWRHVGPRALTEDGSVKSRSTSLVNLEIGRRVPGNARLVFGLFNVLDAKRSDIDYFYRSRLPGEPEDGFDDIHFHPTMPRTFRISLVVGL